jgi:nicotinamide mononucleotide transporter
MSWPELAAVATGALCVYLVVRQHIANFPVGIANNVFYFSVFWQVGLYADAGLQVVYVFLASYGWWWWLRGGPGRTVLTVSRTPHGEGIVLTLIGITSTVALVALLSTTTDSTVPFWDALTTVLSLQATYLLSRKRFENWLVWITADILYIGLYAYKELYLTSVLYVGFLALCVLGLRRWRRDPALQPVAQPSVPV